MKLSIRYKLLLGFTLVLSLSSLIYTLAFQITKDYIIQQVNNFQIEKAQTAQQRIQDFVTTIELFHLSFARTYNSTGSFDSQEVFNVVNYTLTENPFLNKVVFLETTGRELIKIDKYGIASENNLSYEIPTTPFQIAIAGETAISKVYYSEASSKPQVDVFTPIFNNQFNVKSIIKSQINLDQLWDLVAQIKLGSEGFAYVVDEEGRLIAHPDPDYLSQGPILMDRPIIQYILQDNTDNLTNNDYQYTNENGTKVVSKGKKVPRLNWVVITEQPTSEAFAFLTFSTNLYYLTFAGSFILLVIISLFLSENLTRPIRELREFTELLKQGTLRNRLHIKSGDEIEGLASSFNIMAERLTQRENSLRTKKKQTDTLMQSLMDGVFAMDHETNILLFNRAAEQITGLKSADVLGKKLDQVIPFYSRTGRINILDYVQETNPNDEARPFKKAPYIKTPSGKKPPISFTVAPVEFEDSKKPGWIVTIHDITREQELEDMKLDFVAMAAHELRTPLTAIRGYLDILSEEVGSKINDQEKTFLQRSIISSQQLAALVENLLNVSRIEKGNLKLELHPIAVEKLIKEAIQHASELASQKNINLIYNKPNFQSPDVIVDEFRVGEVLTNLVTNAIQYTRENGYVKISLEDNGPDVIVHVEDNGQGIPREAMSHMFTKFYRVSGKLSQGSKGTGLGLFISKAIIDTHGGKIWVESEENKGSTFSFTLHKATAIDTAADSNLR